MARIFIYDSSPERIRAIFYSLRDEGHDIHTNMDDIHAPISHQELDPVRAIFRIWDHWQGVFPDVIIMDCLGVDSAKFLEELHKPFFRENTKVVIMSDYPPRANSLLRRLMGNYGAIFRARPFSVARLTSFIQVISLPKKSKVFEPGIIFKD